MGRPEDVPDRDSDSGAERQLVTGVPLLVPDLVAAAVGRQRNVIHENLLSLFGVVSIAYL